MQKIIDKIKALRARAADAASSEAEAAKAAAVADKLLREHNLSIDDVEVRAAGVVCRVWNPGCRVRSPEGYAASKVAKATGVEAWVANGGEITFLESPTDVEVSLYYMDLVREASKTCLRAYSKTPEYAGLKRCFSPRRISRDFRIGVCSRLGERIRDANTVAEQAQPTGTGIIVVKNALIREWLDDHGLRFRTSRVGAAANAAGRSAAETVGIGRGVGTQRTGQALIGGQ